MKIEIEETEKKEKAVAELDGGGCFFHQGRIWMVVIETDQKGNILCARIDNGESVYLPQQYRVLVAEQTKPAEFKR